MSDERAGFETSPLHLESSGEGEPSVVLVHGFGAHGHSWRKWIPLLEARHRVHVVDLMGFGRAAIPSGGDYSPRAQAGHLVERLRRLTDRSMVLVGHSLGAAVALLAALRVRDEGGAIPVKGLVLVSGAVYSQRLPIFLSLARFPLVGDLAFLGTPPRWALRRGIRGIVHDPATVDREQVDGYRGPLTSFRRRRAMIRAARQLDTAQGDALAARLGELTLPTLLVWGKHDRIIPASSGTRLSRDLFRSRLVVLDGVGHLPPEEDPEASVAPVLEFLGNLEGTPTGG